MEYRYEKIWVIYIKITEKIDYRKTIFGEFDYLFNFPGENFYLEDSLFRNKWQKSEWNPIGWISSKRDKNILESYRNKETTRIEKITNQSTIEFIIKNYELWGLCLLEIQGITSKFVLPITTIDGLDNYGQLSDTIICLQYILSFLEFVPPYYNEIENDYFYHILYLIQAKYKKGLRVLHGFTMINEYMERLLDCIESDDIFEYLDGAIYDIDHYIGEIIPRKPLTSKQYYDREFRLITLLFPSIFRNDISEISEKYIIDGSLEMDLLFERLDVASNYELKKILL